MEIQNNSWQINVLQWDDKRCIHSSLELLDYIENVGFLPLFQNKIRGFSVEELTASES